MLTALDAIRAAGMKTRSNIKFAFEGEEEAGSANLEKILAANKELFAGDLWLMCDGPVLPDAAATDRLRRARRDRSRRDALRSAG